MCSGRQPQRKPVSRDQLAPSRRTCRTRVEQAQHADILRVPVPWDESRLRGPVLTLAAFITHAAQTMRARYVAKVDDDAYVDVAGLEYVMRRVHAEVPGRNKYLGMITWQSWFPEKWDRVGFGWRHAEAERGGAGPRAQRADPVRRQRIQRELRSALHAPEPQ